MAILQPNGSASKTLKDSKTIKEMSNEIDSIYITPELFGAVGDGVVDDSNAIKKAIDAAEAGNSKLIYLKSLYKVSPTNFIIPSNVSIAGGGAGTGILMSDAPSTPMFEIFTIPGNNTTLRNFSIKFNTEGLGSISSVQVYGVFVKDTASYCTLDSLYIEGKFSDSVMGFSNGIRLTGTSNTMKNCVVTHCSMGATVRGEKLSILSNRMDNGYTVEDGTAWTSSKSQWDGISCEGIIDCLIDGNTCTNNGQSGIYIGGGGNGYSSGNIITNNRCYHNWNRGIDTGISGTKSSTNNVTNFTIEGNHLRDNRETQLWMFGTNNSRVVNNSIVETDEYATLFRNNSSDSRAGLALGQRDWCVNNIVENNSIQVRNVTPFSIVLNGFGHKIGRNNIISGGDSSYYFGAPTSILMYNDLEFYTATFNPVLRAGSTGVTLTSGKGSYTISGNKIEYNIEVLISATNASGNLYIGTLSPTSGLLLKDQEVEISYCNGFNNNYLIGSELQGSFIIDNPDQIVINRIYGADIINDIPSCISTGTKLRIKAKATVNTTNTTDTTPGISFFGHSFLSEQGFSNRVGEALGKRVYNFARGGSSSTETALMSGAIQHSYIPVGGVIPASGPVDLSPNEDAVWYAGAFAYVTFAGIPGIVNSVSVGSITNKLVFTRTTSGAAVPVTYPTQLVVLPQTRQNSWSTKSQTDHSSYKNDIVIIQCLRNNSSWGQGMIDIASIVSSLGTERYVILPEFPYSTETIGTAGATTVNTYNDLLKTTYPNNYCQINGIDLLQNFKNNHNPAYPQDVTDLANGVTPSSLRYDSLHPSRYQQSNALISGVRVNADFVARFIKTKGWC